MALQECLLNKDDYLILAGSIQNSLPRDLYLNIQDALVEKEVLTIVDTSGEALLESIKRKPFLIKPNNKEIEEIFNVQLKGIDDIHKLLSKITINKYTFPIYKNKNL